VPNKWERDRGNMVVLRHWREQVMFFIGSFDKDYNTVKKKTDGSGKYAEKTNVQR